MIVEVFKTNVQEVVLSHWIIGEVLSRFPNSVVNFDMDDCDRILRVEAETVVPEKIIEILNTNGYLCEVLE